ncbi:MAG TPA: TonB-dependent receptor plug domain-containing protein, partial [Brevundimonas diminuta]|nr:TonB-dependent receptor plug domain-containing protein [Brevundimonas diminuta]
MISAVRAASLASASLSVLAFAAPVMAEAAIDEGPTQVSEIVVTAERREAPLAATPLSLTVASQPLLDGVGVRDIKDLQILAPGLIVASTSNQTFTTARIRGVGTVGDNPGVESSVGVMIDGVYR